MRVKISKLKEIHRPAGEPNRAEHSLHNITGVGMQEEKGESPSQDPDIDGDGEIGRAHV